MKWISSFWMLCVVRLINAVCECGNGKQAVIPSKIIIDAPSPFNDTDGSPSSFGSTCVEQLTDLYTCMGNNDNPLFDCNSNDNRFYGWNSSSVLITMDFTSDFESLNVLITFLISASSNTSVPSSVWYLASSGNNTSSNDNNASSIVQDNLPTNLPEGPYQRNFTLSPDMMFNEVFIIFSNFAFEWVAISRIIFCAATIEDRNATFSSAMSSTTSITVTTYTELGSSVSVAITPATSSSVSTIHMSSTVPSLVHTMSWNSAPPHATSINPASATATASTTITVGGSLSSNTDNSVSIGVIIGASLGSLLLIIVVLLIVIILLNRRRKHSKIDDKLKGVTIKMPSKHDQNAQQNTAGKFQHDHGDNEVPSQVVNAETESRLKRVNELYIPSKVGLLHLSDDNRSIPSVGGCDVSITPNPSYDTSTNVAQTRQKKCDAQYDYVQTDDEIALHDYLQLVEAPSSGIVNDYIVNDPIRDNNVNMNVNPSYSLPPRGQDV